MKVITSADIKKMKEEMLKYFFDKLKYLKERAERDDWSKTDLAKFDFLKSRIGIEKTAPKIEQAKKEIDEIVKTYGANYEITKAKILEKYGLPSLNITKTSEEDFRKMFNDDIPEATLNSLGMAKVFYEQVEHALGKYYWEHELKSIFYKWFEQWYELSDYDNPDADKIICRYSKELFVKWCKNKCREIARSAGWQDDWKNNWNSEVVSIYPSSRGNKEMVQIGYGQSSRWVNFGDCKKAIKCITEKVEPVVKTKIKEETEKNLKKTNEKMVESMFPDCDVRNLWSSNYSDWSVSFKNKNGDKVSMIVNVGEKAIDSGKECIITSVTFMGIDGNEVSEVVRNFVK